MKKISTTIVYTLFIIIVTLLTIAATITSKNMAQDFSETQIWNFKNNAISLPISFAITAIILITYKQITNMSQASLKALSAIYTLAVCFTWTSIINWSPTQDQRILIDIASNLNTDFNNGYLDTYGINLNEYIQMYPFQTGYILFYKAFGWLWGYQNWTAIRLFNSIMVTGCVLAIFSLTNKIYSRQAAHLSIVITGLFLPLFLFSNFAYGNIPSLCCALFALLEQIKATESKRTSVFIKHTSTSIFLIILATIFKPNALIFVLTMCIIWLIEAITNNKYILLIPLFATFIGYKMVVPLTTSIFSIMSGGVVFNHAIPLMSHFAMGLQESEALRLPGWFNGYSITVYRQAHGDPSLMQEIATDAVIDRLSIFISQPVYAASFFIRKVCSMWTEPTFQSLWISFGGGHGFEPFNGSWIQHSIVHGKLFTIYNVFCDAVQSLIYLFACAYLWSSRKNITFKHLYLAIAFLGGFLYHLLSEGKSDYVLPYFILLIPYASAGFVIIRSYIDKLLTSHKFTPFFK
ncbi:hypothetical protein [Bifidobacterium sp. UTBIF-68]|uniref:hypothetical protein n=1 Tax=Bifidobacterium sp. UTBIF-68 TaxID=1465262 RepID=UPI00112CB03E|nr:hypothetical protein [Bifidobacterium sp. UTBIF-68]